MSVRKRHLSQQKANSEHSTVVGYSIEQNNPEDTGWNTAQCSLLYKLLVRIRLDWAEFNAPPDTV